MAWCRPGDKPLSEPMMGLIELALQMSVITPKATEFGKAVCDDNVID